MDHGDGRRQEDNIAASRTSRHLERAMKRTSDAPLRPGNGLVLLKDGPATYEDWLEAIGGAKRWVHLENYIFENDHVGRMFAAALSEKAREGVPVRVVYDWFGSFDVPRSFWAELRGAGVEVRAANPPSPRKKPRRLLPRDHSKVVAVDGDYASVGGVCIGDGWLERSSETGLPYRDTAVGIRGPAVADVERAFAGVWDLSGEEPLPADERPDAAGVRPAGDQAARVVVQEPGEARTLRALQLLMAAVEERVWITDAYFLSVPILTRSILAAARDGIDVRIILPATNDLPLVGALSRAGYRPLLEGGVRIFEYAGPMIHAKTHVADSFFSRVGSTNLNLSGLWANWEADLLVEDESFGAQMEALFEEDLESSREIRLGSTTRGRRRPLPERPLDASERRDRSRIQRGSLPGGLRGSPGGAAATASRLGGEALRSFGDDAASLQSQERKVRVAFSTGVLGLSLLGLRYPRAVAWPLGALGGLTGALGLLGAAARQEKEPAGRSSREDLAR